MKLDMDLVRDILKFIENHDSEKIDQDSDIKINNIEERTIKYHLTKMYEGDLINYDLTPYSSGEYDLQEIALTWDGHQFLEQIRADSFWQKVKSKIAAAGTGLTITAIKIVAPILAKELLTK